MMKKVCLSALVALAAAAASATDTKLLEELVAIPSVSSDIAAVNRAQRHMQSWLESKGVSCVRETMDNGREIVFASTRPGKVQDYLLVVHLDVAAASFPEQYAARIEGDWMFGRGTDDCKGSCVAVAEALVRLNGKASVGVIFGSDEEIGGKSTRWMYEQGYRPGKMVIVVDSRWNAISYTSKGHTIFTVTAHGKGGHSARPWDAKDSIAEISAAYLKLRAAWDREHPLTEDKWCDILVATVLKADGGAVNSIPSEASLVLNLRGVSADSADRAEKLIAEVTGLEVTRGGDSKPFATDPDHPLIRRLQATMRRQYAGEEIPLVRNPATNDARCFYDIKLPVAVIGVNGRGGHGPSEAVNIPNLGAVTELLVTFISE